MTQEFQIRVLPEVAASEKAIKHFLQEEKGLAAGTIKAVRVLKRSIDARQRTIYVNLKVRVIRTWKDALRQSLWVQVRADCLLHCD